MFGYTPLTPPFDVSETGNNNGWCALFGNQTPNENDDLAPADAFARATLAQLERRVRDYNQRHPSGRLAQELFFSLSLETQLATQRNTQNSQNDRSTLQTNYLRIAALIYNAIDACQAEHFYDYARALGVSRTRCADLLNDKTKPFNETRFAPILLAAYNSACDLKLGEADPEAFGQLRSMFEQEATDKPMMYLVVQRTTELLHACSPQSSLSDMARDELIRDYSALIENVSGATQYNGLLSAVLYTVLSIVLIGIGSAALMGVLTLAPKFSLCALAGSGLTVLGAVSFWRMSRQQGLSLTLAESQRALLDNSAQRAYPPSSQQHLCAPGA